MKRRSGRMVAAIATVVAILFGVSIIAVVWWLPREQNGVLAIPGHFNVATQEVRPGEPQACMAALLEGVLVEDETYGFVVRGPTGVEQVVLWPPGYYGIQDDRATLIDGSGVAVGQAGDRLQIGGGENLTGAWIACAFERPVVVARAAT